MRTSNGVKKMTAICLAVVFFVALDRFLKVYALANFVKAQNLLGEILQFNFKANYYIAFSLPLYGIWLNVVILLIVLLLIYYLARAWRGGQWKTAACLFAIIMGAASNLFDRLRYGYVIDYLDLKYFTVFNLADIMIIASVASLLLTLKSKNYE